MAMATLVIASGLLLVAPAAHAQEPEREPVELAPPARTAAELEQEIAALVATARDGAAEESQRINAVIALGRLGSDATPHLAEMLRESRGDGRLRRFLFHALRSADGPAIEGALAAVEPIVEDESDPLQELAESVFVHLREQAGIERRSDWFARKIEQRPFDPRVRGWLMRLEDRNDPDRPDPRVQAVKQRWRERLAEQPDAGLALALAGVILDQLHGNELGYCAATIYMPRERSGENHETLASALRLAQRHAEKWTPDWQRATRGLAKLALLRGDWEAMNAELAELGQAPVPAERRPWLAPPPKDWRDLAASWQPCDAALRSGDCAFELTVEKDGRGVRGAHVLVRKMPPESHSWYSGFDPRTLFHDPQPIDWGVGPSGSGFGYEADDRAQCRYAVTGDDGVARFEKLPPIEIQIEVMIPTASFAETFSRWDLFVRQPDGTLELDHYRGREGYTLKPGETVRGPQLVVRPHFALNVADGDAIAARDFELAWTPIAAAAATESAERSGPVRYEVELMLSFPPSARLERPDSMPRLETATAETTGCSWPIGASGVGGLALVPGNVYLVQVTAKDAAGELLARFGRTWCYVPWAHRDSAAPLRWDLASVPDSAQEHAFPPIDSRQWHSGQYHRANGTIESLPERLDRFLRERPDAFELEYVRVARAWLDWRAGRSDAARAALDEIARATPEGNVAGDTARALLRKIETGADPGRALQFAIAR